MSNIRVTGYYLENRTANHSKFYTVLVADNGVCVQAWGRIGTSGQAKIQRLQSLSDAEAVGRSKAYAKRSEGYSMLTEELAFSIDESILDEACKLDDAKRLTVPFHKARTEPQYQGAKRAVTDHYDEFVEKAQRLLATAGDDRPFDEVYAEFEELETAWQTISDKHGQAEVTINLTRQMLSQRLMSGALS